MFFNEDMKIGSYDGRDLFMAESARRLSMQVIGAPGRGKSRFMQHMIIEDIIEGRGVCVLDPHGSLYDGVVAWLTEKQQFLDKPVVLFEAANKDYAFAYNPLKTQSKAVDDRYKQVDELFKAFMQVWREENSSKPTINRVLKSMLDVLIQHGLTLHEALAFFDPKDADGVRYLLTSLSNNPAVRTQWQAIAQKRPREYDLEITGPVNRLSDFLSSPRVSNIISQKDRSLSFPELIEQDAIILIDMRSRGKITESNARMLGTLMVNDLLTTFLRRKEGSKTFSVYIDECHRFLTPSVENLLLEGRKFGCNLVLGHQNLQQLRKEGDDIYHAVMTGAQTKIVFGTENAEDAEILANSMWSEYDLKEVKNTSYQTVGFKTILLKNNSSTSSESKTESVTEGVTYGEGVSYSTGESESEALRITADGAETDGSVVVVGTSSGSGYSSFRSESYVTAKSVTGGRSWTSGESEAREAILEERASDFYSLPEQQHRAAAKIRKLDKREAFFKVPTQDPVKFETPFISDSYTLEKDVEAFKEKVFFESGIVVPNRVVEEEKEHRKQYLLQCALNPIQTETDSIMDSFFEVTIEEAKVIKDIPFDDLEDMLE